MRKIIVILLLSLLFICCCEAQKTIIGDYIGYKYLGTKNTSFINRELSFLVNNDTLRINIKIPFDITNPQIINHGIYYNCHLKQSSIYTIKLQKLCVKDIPEYYNTYYQNNTIIDEVDCTKFIEIEKNTEYDYKGPRGGYGKYVDINGCLYEIIGLVPDNDCFYPH